MVGELVDSIEVVNNFIVLRRLPASRAASRWRSTRPISKGVAGSLAGDDTVFVMCYSSIDAENVAAVISQAARSINQRFATRSSCEHAFLKNPRKQKMGTDVAPFSYICWNSR